jgi:hypothetical protein
MRRFWLLLVPLFFVVAPAAEAGRASGAIAHLRIIAGATERPVCEILAGGKGLYINYVEVSNNTGITYATIQAATQIDQDGAGGPVTLQFTYGDAALTSTAACGESTDAPVGDAGRLGAWTMVLAGSNNIYEQPGPIFIPPGSRFSIFLDADAGNLLTVIGWTEVQ